LTKLPRNERVEVMVDASTLDDAGVYRLSDDLALVQTVDFFTPIVDNPFDYGRIAAANSLSDIYAMGAVPLTALNILAFPADKLDEEALAEIFLGSQQICEEAGVAVLGGHSVTDNELKFGLAVTGTVHPDRILRNDGAKPGDVLILTKPLGTGLIANALMNGAAAEEYIDAMVQSMTRLNRFASEQALKAAADAATDVTGFGLFGHAGEMAKASNVSILFCAETLPLLPGAFDIASSKSYYSAGERRNQEFLKANTLVEEDVAEPFQRIVSDPQTSGGLLISLTAARADALIRELEAHGEPAWRIGMVIPEQSDYRLRLIAGAERESWERLTELAANAMKEDA